MSEWPKPMVILHEVTGFRFHTKLYSSRFLILPTYGEQYAFAGAPRSQSFEQLFVELGPVLAPIHRFVAWKLGDEFLRPGGKKVYLYTQVG